MLESLPETNAGSQRGGAKVAEVLTLFLCDSRRSRHLRDEQLKDDLFEMTL